MRLDVQTNIRHRVLGGSELEKKNTKFEHFSVTKNLSAGGLVFASHDQPRIGSVLELEIELPRDKTIIHCHAKTVRIVESKEKGNYDISLCFLDLSGADRAKLSQSILEEVP